MGAETDGCVRLPGQPTIEDRTEGRGHLKIRLEATVTLHTHAHTHV